MTEHKDPHSIHEIVEDLDELAVEQHDVSIGDALDMFGGRSYGPFLIIPALLEISPAGAVPGVPSVLAAIVALVALQMLFGREHIWMPRFVEKRSISGKKLHGAIGKLDRVATMLDSLAKGRMKGFARGPWLKAMALAVIALAITVPPLELVPFASAGPMLVIALMGLALIVRDGLLMLLSMGAAIAVVITGYTLFGQSSGAG